MDAADGSSLGSGPKASFTFHDPGTKYVTLTITDRTGHRIRVEHDVVVRAKPVKHATPKRRTPPVAARSATGARLSWAPPRCGDSRHRCVDLNLSNTGSHQNPSLNTNTDYRIHLPSGPLEGGLTISGGHNVIIIGGQIDMPVPCSDGGGGPCRGIYISRPAGSSGTIFLEGIWVHGPSTGNK
jgi:hypothetical protein